MNDGTSLLQLQWTNFLIIPGLLIGFTIHELAHAITAYLLGDHSQVESGKITLNPLRHISWFGSIAFVWIGIGWPNPVEFNAQNLKNRPLMIGLVALAGPFASFTFSLATLLFTLSYASLLVFSTGTSSDQVLQFFFPPIPAEYPSNFDMQALALAFSSKIASASFWMAVISMIPLPPVAGWLPPTDGYVALVSLAAYMRQRRQGLPAPPLAAPVPVPVIIPTQPRGPINQYKRRDNVSDLHFKLGTEYHQENKFDDAIARYRQALENDKNFGPAYVNLGLAYLGKGRRREAIHAFRGAVQYSDDQKSKQEAWYQLHQLSGVSPVSASADEDMAELGASPWVDTKPRPNWLALGFGGLLVTVAAVAFYSYLFSGLVKLLVG